MKKSKKKEPEKQHKKSECCPICGQYMDIYCTCHRNSPFVDDKCYPKICFVCYWVPKTIEQTYEADGSIKEEISLEYSHRNLHSPEELFHQGTAESLQEAKQCVRAVIAACKAAGLDGRKKGKAKKRPDDPETEIPD